MKVILVEPQIPQNTGNVVRTCAVTGCDLTLIRPLGFSTNDRWLKRAGLDYWQGVDVSIEDDLRQVISNAPGQAYFFSSKGDTPYSNVSYQENDCLVFGAETHGLPDWVFKEYPDRIVTLPMQSNVRCLNLATSVGIGVYEAWRQLGFKLKSRSNDLTNCKTTS